MDVNRISGYIPGKLVFFLMQVRLCVCAYVCVRTCTWRCIIGGVGGCGGVEGCMETKKLVYCAP
jgi:hypothetical protein